MYFPKNILLKAKVIGYFAQAGDGTYCSTEPDKILVAGSAEKFMRYINPMEASLKNKVKSMIKKIRFIDIAEKMEQGNSFLFDKESFIRFVFRNLKVGTDIFVHRLIRC